MTGRPPAGAMLGAERRRRRRRQRQRPRSIYQDKTRNVLGPQWSPSGDTIIFGIGVFNAFFNGFNGLFLKPEDRAEGGAQIAMVNADGSGFRELTSGAEQQRLPVDGAGRQAVRLPDRSGRTATACGS